MAYAHIFILSATPPETIEMAATAKPIWMNQKRELDMVRPKPKSPSEMPVSKAQ